MMWPIKSGRTQSDLLCYVKDVCTLDSTGQDQQAPVQLSGKVVSDDSVTYIGH